MAYKFAIGQVQEAKTRVLNYSGTDSFMLTMKRRAERPGWVPTPAEASKVLHYSAGPEPVPIPKMEFTSSRRTDAEAFLQSYEGPDRFLRSVKNQKRLTDNQVTAVLRKRAHLTGIRLDTWG